MVPQSCFVTSVIVSIATLWPPSCSFSTPPTPPCFNMYLLNVHLEQCHKIGVWKRTLFCQINLIVLFCVVISSGLLFLFAFPFYGFSVFRKVLLWQIDWFRYNFHSLLHFSSCLSPFLSLALLHFLNLLKCFTSNIRNSLSTVKIRQILTFGKKAYAIIFGLHLVKYCNNSH